MGKAGNVRGSASFEPASQATIQKNDCEALGGRRFVRAIE